MCLWHCSLKERCLALPLAEQRQIDAVDQLAKMWCKMVAGVSGVAAAGTSMKRSQADWQVFHAAEVKKAMKKNVKQLAQTLADQLVNRDVNSELPTNFPPEVTTCWKTTVEAASEPLETALANLKKDFLANATASIDMQSQKEAEEKHCEEFEKRVLDALEASKDAGVGGISVDAAPLKNSDVVTVPPKISDNNHWRAHQAAAMATSVILRAYAGHSIPESPIKMKGPGANLLVAEDLSGLSVFKKKLSLRVETGTADEAQLQSKLDGICLALTGRLIVVPQGQPASSFKNKIRVNSEYFKKLGADLYVVPITQQQSADLAIRSPLLVPAWLVKSKAKGGCMKFKYEEIRMDDPLQSGTEIDLFFPFLVFSTSADQATVVKTVDDAAVEHQWKGFELGRALTDLELAEAGEKAKQKSEKQDQKKQREQALEADFYFDGLEDPIHQTDKDNQIQVSSAFLKHALR